MKAKVRVMIAGDHPMKDLTTAERNVLALLTEYKTNKEMASILGISTRTVENHRANICEKLGLRGAHALVKFAIRQKSDFS